MAAILCRHQCVKWISFVGCNSCPPFLHLMHVTLLCSILLSSSSIELPVLASDPTCMFGLAPRYTRALAFHHLFYSFKCYYGIHMIHTPGAHFTNGFSIIIQIGWKIWISMTPLWGIILLQNFAHGTTAQLSCHVQNFIVIRSLWLEWEQDEVSIEW